MIIGIDFGNDTCYISVARTGGIETIDNDYSLRATPSFVAFGERQRVMGVSAKNQLLTNLQKTVFGFKHLLGRKYNDPVVQENICDAPYFLSQGKDGNILIRVDYLGEENAFTPEQITAMLFTKLKNTAENALKANVKDLVISCPSYFTDGERKALLSAGSIAGLNVLKLEDAETWLYEDGNDCDKRTYIEKLKQLKIFGNALISKLEVQSTSEPTEEHQ